VTPATLVFRNVYNLHIDLEALDIEIDDIQRSNPNPPKNIEHIEENIEYDWVIETTRGEITFTSVGFKQYLRKEPVILNPQNVGLKERGGTSFERT
jgi:hypothetical protein